MGVGSGGAARAADFDVVQALRQIRLKVDPVYAAVIVFLHLGAVAALFFFQWKYLAALVILHIITGIGITVGYHRLLTHRSFEASAPVEWLLSIAGVLALQGGPCQWVAQHRQHHVGSDTELDPHDIHRGFWWAHIFWVFKRYPAWMEAEVCRKYAPDLLKSRFQSWLERNAYSVNAVFALAVLLLGGWKIFLWAICFRVVLVYHCTFFVNSAAHLWGYRPNKEHIATNNWWVALLTYGEGWHNNHHAYPTSARQGLRAWEIDPSWMLIWTLSKLGLARKIKLPERSRLPWAKIA